jgi:hypothetical protein
MTNRERSEQPVLITGTGLGLVRPDRGEGGRKDREKSGKKGKEREYEFGWSPSREAREGAGHDIVRVVRRGCGLAMTPAEFSLSIEH